MTIKASKKVTQKSDSLYGLPLARLNVLLSILRAEPNVLEARVFGSRALGTYRSGSDLDLALLGADLSLEDELRIASKLNHALGLIRVDVVRYDRLKHTALKEHIDTMGAILFQA